MKVWIVEMYERGIDMYDSETTIDSIWTDKDKAKERVEILKKRNELGREYYYYSMEINKVNPQFEDPDSYLEREVIE